MNNLPEHIINKIMFYNKEHPIAKILKESSIFNYMKLRTYYDTYNDSDYSCHWQNARTATRNRNNGEFNKTVLVIIAILILIFLFFIDFDVSIFSA